MPGYSRTPAGRYNPRQNPKLNAFFDEGERSSHRPRSKKTTPNRFSKRKPGKFATRRSRDFIEGMMYERDRLDGYRDPGQAAEGNYGDNPRRFGAMRIGYRT